MNINILICDDDLVFAEALCRFLAEKLPDTIRFQVCDDRNRLLELLEENNHCDLLLMDICLNEDNGICLAKELLTRFPQLPVIFITGYPDLYYEKVFLSLRPYGFVKKPVNEQLLLALVDRAMEEIRRTRQDSRQWILLKTKNGTEKIPIAQIRYVESQKHMLIVHGTGNTWETYGRLGDMALECRIIFFTVIKVFWSMLIIFKAMRAAILYWMTEAVSASARTGGKRYGRSFLGIWRVSSYFCFFGRQFCNI